MILRDATVYQLLIPALIKVSLLPPSGPPPQYACILLADTGGTTIFRANRVIPCAV